MEAREHFPQATLSKLALITKVKESGERKLRLIIDLLRSGGNARARVPERITLPRIVDVVESLRSFYAKRGSEPLDPSWDVGLISAGLADAYMHLPVHPNELGNCLSPGLAEGELVLFKAVAFGFKGAPLTMGRWAAASTRLFQATIPVGEARFNATWTIP
eukprot:s2029_g14.t1